jgi:excisionase family DNA binding protein
LKSGSDYVIIFSIPLESEFMKRRNGYLMGIDVEKWVSLDDVAHYLDVTKDTVRSWIRKGSIPSHKIGKQWKFKISEIDEWVASGKSAEIN